MKTVVTALSLSLAFEVVLVAGFFLATKVASFAKLGILITRLHIPALGLVERLSGEDNWLLLFLVMWFMWFLLFAFVLEIISTRQKQDQAERDG
ncbi:MAG: hypothetical protein ACYDH9_14545 [Limisphaerales bacterium]